ncbi:MAG: ABC transporter permease [Planifilum fulgidum]
MGRILSAEARKFKRSSILWVIAAVVLFPVVVSLVMAMGMEANGHKAPLYIFFSNHFLFVHLLMGAPLFTLIAGYVFSREHQERTINNLLTYPYSRWRWYAGKLLIVVPILALMLGVQFLLQWGVGALYTGEWIPEESYLDTPGDELFVQVIKAVLLGILFQILLIPAGAAAGILGKNAYAPIILGVCVAGINGVILVAGIPMKYAAFNPWFIPVLHSGMMAETPPDDVFLRAYVSLAVVCIVSLTVGLLRFVKADVHSGS